MRVKSYFPILLAYVLLVMSPKSFPQIHIPSQTQELIFEHYTTDQGLSNPIVSCMIQDKTGYLWFGTHSGLDRFDGLEFKTYKYIPGDSTSITNGYVQCLLEDTKGNLWIGTSNGLDKLVTSTETFIHYALLTRNPMDRNSNDITSIQEDKDGFIWIGTSNGLNRFNPVDCTFTYFKHSSSDSTSLSHNQVFTILVDRNDNIWVGTNMGLDKFDKRTGSFIHYWQDPIYRPGLNILGSKTKYSVTSIYEDDSKIIWIGTMDGLIEFDHESKKFTLYRSDPQNPKTLSFHSLRCICKEDVNSLWVGTHNGLNLCDKRTKQFKRIFYNDKVANGISGNNIPCILRERSGTLWITTFGQGINKVNRNIYPFLQYYYKPWRKHKRFSSASILYLDKARDGSVWIGTPIGLMNFDPVQEQFRSYKIKQNIRAIKEDKNGNLWMGVNISSGRGLIKMEKNGRIINVTDSSGNKMMWLVNQIIEDIDNDSTLWLATEDKGGILNLNKFTNKYTVFYSSNINLNTIYQDRDGFIWAGTQNDGLLCFDPSERKVIKHFLSDFKDPKSISSNSVRTICEDNKGNLWLGTDMGVNKFDRDKNTFSYFTESDGLPQNRIDHIFMDSNKNLWMSHRNGVSKLNPLTGTIKNYYVPNGIATPPWLTAGCQLDNGEIYLDSPGGLTHFHPDSIRDNPYIPPMAITNVSVKDRSILFNNEISLSHSENNISFEFAALSYVEPERNQYAYMMEGLDAGWIYTTSKRRYASYTNLDPGKYIFRVKGSNNDGVWNEVGASLRIIILPPWWKTWWAYLFYVAVILSIFISSTKFYLNRQYLKNKLALESEHAEKLEGIAKMKSDFFANISHEFRTPLTLILGPAEKIEKNESANPVKDAGIVTRNSKRLLQLVNQLLDLSKLDAGKLKLEASPGNIVSFIKGTALSFESLFESKDIKLRIKSDKEFIETYFDKDKMIKILSNLLSNALKFTTYGGNITISISEIPDSYVVIKVKDSGIGIPQKELPKLFDRFYQVDSTQTKKYEGTGIGLTLVKELVELHHGSITVISEMGDPQNDETGCTEFTIILPMGKTHLTDDEILIEANKEAEQEIQFEVQQDLNLINIKGPEIIPNETESKTLILVIEDNFDMREYIKQSLDTNYIIEEAINGEQGIRIAKKIIPDLIISDLMMPKMDGIELTRLLKSDEKTSHIPIIILTAKTGQENKLEGLQIGADEYLTKPFDIKELQIRVGNLLNLRKKLQEKIIRGDYSYIKGEKKLDSIDEKFITRVKEVIEKHLSEEDFSIEEFASEIGMSRSQFHRKLKAIVGKSASQYVRSIRLNIAKKMIEEKKGNISEVAYLVGFSSPSYFSYCFKQEFGYSPRNI